jgi:ABC-type molybdate transport system substrate-binding protein
MQHPQSLAAARHGGPVKLFARNRLCALVRPGLTVETTTLLDCMLEPGVKLGTSTPGNDPSGDYAFEVFRKAETLRPGARAALEAKALKLAGGAVSSPSAAGNPYGAFVAGGEADIFLTYCTNALAAEREYPGLRVVALPEVLAVSAGYGLIVMSDAPASARTLVDYIMSVKGQSILAAHGFAPGDA